jgi:uncharacterized small protein (DUF1192 family)
VKKEELEPLKRRIAELEAEVSRMKSWKKKIYQGL